MSDFQKTVDLSEKKAPTKEPSFGAKNPKRPVKKKVAGKKANAIDQVFNDEEEEVKPKNAMHHFARPTKSESDDGFYKKASIVLFLSLILVLGYFIFFKDTKVQAPVVSDEGKSGWYSVELMNGETYYGEIKNTTTDPIVIENVYYNYDQINAEKTEEKTSGSSNLRLVKRGKETHGPDGTMSVVRAQVVFMEPLREESKVLKAILNYEK